MLLLQNITVTAAPNYKHHIHFNYHAVYGNTNLTFETTNIS